MSDDILADLLDTAKRIELLLRRTALEKELREDGGLASSGNKEDPVVRFLPGGCKDEWYKGRKFSETNAPFMRQLRRAFLNMAEKDDAEKRMYKDKPSSVYKRRDAAVAARYIVRFELGELKEHSPPEMPAPPPLPEMLAPASSFPSTTVPSRRQSTFEEFSVKDDEIPF